MSKKEYFIISVSKNLWSGKVRFLYYDKDDEEMWLDWTDDINDAKVFYGKPDLQYLVRQIARGRGTADYYIDLYGISAMRTDLISFL